MSPESQTLPIFELTRGQAVESVHAGALAVTAADGRLLASYGDPDLVAFLRSTSKPLQALPLVERGGPAHFGLTLQEVAIVCASHTGTAEHIAAVRSLQAKTGVSEAELLCGPHDPYDAAANSALRARGEAPTPNHNNCSGKHSGMLALAHLLGVAAQTPDQDYLDVGHPVQQIILETFAEMCALPTGQVVVGVDGCSAPTFAVPLRSAALALARLCDPQAGQVVPPRRAAACSAIVQAMLAHPEMIAGPGRFDTLLMQAAPGRLISKGGAEGYQGVALLPGALGQGSPAVGIALKIADGDQRARIRPAVMLEVLRQIGALTAAELVALAEFGPTFPVHNWRKLVVGEGRPVFDLGWRGAW